MAEPEEPQSGRGAGRRRVLGEGDRALLLQLPLFTGLTGEELDALLSDARVEAVASDAVIFLQGDPARHFFVVLEGWVKLFRTTAEGDEAVIAIVPRGQSFAEAAVFEERSYPVSAAPVEDSRLLFIPAQSFLEKILNDRQMVLKMMGSMSQRLRQLVTQVEDLSLKSSVERLAGYLVGLCPQTSGAAIIRLPLDKALIARHLGMQPETLSRSLSRLRTLGIAAEGDHLIIPDVALLQELSGQSGGRQSGVA